MINAIDSVIRIGSLFTMAFGFTDTVGNLGTKENNSVKLGNIK